MYCIPKGLHGGTGPDHFGLEGNAWAKEGGLTTESRFCSFSMNSQIYLGTHFLPRFPLTSPTDRLPCNTGSMGSSVVSGKQASPPYRSSSFMLVSHSHNCDYFDDVMNQTLQSNQSSDRCCKVVIAGKLIRGKGLVDRIV